MIRVRRMLTDMLLEVTDYGVHGIARSAYNKANASASNPPATKLAKSINAPGTGYSSDSESGDDGSDDDDDRRRSGTESPSSGSKDDYNNTIRRKR